MRLFETLTARLLLAFATVIVVGIALVAVIANHQTTSEFDAYVASGQRVAAAEIADVVTQTYTRSGSWNVVAAALADWTYGPVSRVVVTDTAGTVVVDTAGAALGRSGGGLALPAGQAIVVRGRTAGTLYVFTGRGAQAGGRWGAGRGTVPQQIVSQAERAFLDRVNRSLLVGAVAAALVALLIGVVLARRITLPLRELTRAAQQMAAGSYDTPIAVRGTDEVGRLGQALTQLTESLARTEDARRQLVADVAHELRTPLTVLKGTVQAMSDGVLETSAQNLATVQEEVGTLARLVSDLHDLALGDVDRFSLQRERLSVGALIEHAVASFAAAATAQGVDLRSEVAPNVPDLVGDRERLGQALRNLVANALRYTPAGGTVVVGARPLAEGVALTVRDSGAGIGAEHLPHIFERFYRADPSRARRSGGSGLGLAIVQQIVQAHGGEVTVSSAGADRGASFTILLPYAENTPARQ